MTLGEAARTFEENKNHTVAVAYLEAARDALAAGEISIAAAAQHRAIVERWLDQ